MLGNQEFKNALRMLQAAREARLSGHVDLAMKRERWAYQEYKKMDAHQKGAFECFESSTERSNEELEELRFVALGPLGQLSPANRNPSGSVKAVRGFAERLLNLFGGGYAGRPSWLLKKAGGSQYKSIQSLVDRGLLKVLRNPEGEPIGWAEGPELRLWIEAGGFVAGSRS